MTPCPYCEEPLTEAESVYYGAWLVHRKCAHELDYMDNCALEGLADEDALREQRANERVELSRDGRFDGVLDYGWREAR